MRTSEGVTVMSSSEPHRAAGAVSRQEFRTVMAGLLLVLTLASLDQNIVATALPGIVSELGGLSHLSWVVTAFLVASTATTDARTFHRYGDTPAICFGPRAERIHSTDERVHLPSMLRTAQALALFVRDWCGVTAAP